MTAKYYLLCHIECMRTFTRGLAAIATAAALTFSGTAVATAQSSFGSLSSSSSNGSPFIPQTTEQRVRAAAEGALNRLGHTKSASATERAQFYADQAAQGAYDSHFRYSNEYTIPYSEGFGAVYRIPSHEAEAFIHAVNAPTEPALLKVRYGVGVASDGSYIYISELFTG